MNKTTYCESCEAKPATRHCKNPDFSSYNLCDECAAEYDSRPHGVIEASKERE